MSTWMKKFKTLPNTQPGFASGLCSMVCLWLVLIPALVLVLQGAVFSLTRLIIPSPEEQLLAGQDKLVLNKGLLGAVCVSSGFLGDMLCFVWVLV